MIWEDNHFLTPAQKKISASINTNIGNFCRDQWKQWDVTTDAEIIPAVKSIFAYYENQFVPELVKFGDLTHMYSILCENNLNYSHLFPSIENQAKCALGIAYILKRPRDEISKLIGRKKIFLEELNQKSNQVDLAGFEVFCSKIENLLSQVL